MLEVLPKYGVFLTYISYDVASHSHYTVISNNDTCRAVQSGNSKRICYKML
jgi:hypothetical protein